MDHYVYAFPFPRGQKLRTINSYHIELLAGHKGCHVSELRTPKKEQLILTRSRVNTTGKERNENDSSFLKGTILALNLLQPHSYLIRTIQLAYKSNTCHPNGPVSYFNANNT